MNAIVHDLELKLKFVELDKFSNEMVNYSFSFVAINKKSLHLNCLGVCNVLILTNDDLSKSQAGLISSFSCRVCFLTVAIVSDCIQVGQ